MTAAPDDQAPLPLPLPKSPPLAVYIVWHPDDEGSKELSDAIFTEMQGNPSDGGSERIGIPVRVLTTTEQGPSRPAPLPTDPIADEELVVVLAGDQLLADEDYRTYLTRLRETLETRSPKGLLPVALGAATFSAQLTFGRRSAVRVTQSDPDRRRTQVLTAVLSAVGERLGDRRPKVFVSHAKRDGAQLARQVHDAVSSARLGGWLDAYDIPEGADFGEFIGDAIDSAFVAVLTDTYSTREWCRYEAMTAKRRGVPIAVLNALERTELRSIPYLGNVPVVRVGDDLEATLERLVHVTLIEAVRVAYARFRLSSAIKVFDHHRPGACPLEVRPEPVTVRRALQLAGDEPVAEPVVVYPDPPLPVVERELLQDTLGSSIELQSLTEFMVDPRLHTDDVAEVSDHWIALSVSDPSPEELAEHGLTLAHIGVVFAELSRHILMAGHGIAYGGHLELRQFTDLLLDLAQIYDPAVRGASAPGNGDGSSVHGEPATHQDLRVKAFVTGQIWDGADPAQRARALNLGHVEVVRLDVPPRRPDGAPDSDYFALNDDAVDLAATTDPADLARLLPTVARRDRTDPQYHDDLRDKRDELANMLTLTEMRRRMSRHQNIRARIVVGGKQQGARGRSSGVLEEAALSLQHGLPLFILGGFGGVGEAIARQLGGDIPMGLYTTEYERRATEVWPFLRKDDAARTADMLALFRSDDPYKVPELLRNGLTVKENHALLTSSVVDEVVPIVMRGLSRLLNSSGA
ncbi:MAG: TIR domain-containing protein [Actinomycetota bacterium]